MMLYRFILTALLCMQIGTSLAAQTKQYQFKVFLDDKHIGQHRFQVIRDQLQTLVKSEAKFDLNFMFLNLYRYRHSSQEVWQGNCLKSIHTTTVVNGEKSFVRGNSGESAMRVKTADDSVMLEGCIRSFAYWDVAALDAGFLLNSQTGKLLPVVLEKLGHSPIWLRGKPVNAHHYRIKNESLSIDLWYSESLEWLALESLTEQGARLRYIAE